MSVPLSNKTSTDADQAAESLCQQRLPPVTTAPSPLIVEAMSWQQRQEATAGASPLLARQPLSPALSAVGQSAGQMSIVLSQQRVDWSVGLTFSHSVFLLSFPFLSSPRSLSYLLSQVRKHITDLYEDLRDGHNLISLLEVLSGVTLVWIFISLSHTHTRLQKLIIYDYFLTYYHTVVFSITHSSSAPSHTLSSPVQGPIVLRMLRTLFKNTTMLRHF